MNKKVAEVAFVCALVLALGWAARAADEFAKVAGTWELSMKGREGTITQTLTIEQDGGKIKGTLKGERGDADFEGTVTGNKISFTVKRETPRGEMTVEYTHQVKGQWIFVHQPDQVCWWELGPFSTGLKLFAIPAPWRNLRSCDLLESERESLGIIPFTQGLCSDFYFSLLRSVLCRRRPHLRLGCKSHRK